MAFLLGVCRYDLGDVHDTVAVMGEIVFLCRQGRVEEARALAEATKRHIAASSDLSRRPYMAPRLKEVMEIIERAEKARGLL